MEVIKRKRWGIKITQIWFNDKANIEGIFLILKDADLIEFKESFTNVTGYLSIFNNAVIPLDRPIDEIYKNLDKGFKYEVRRAIKEEIECKSYELDNSSLNYIYETYKSFSVKRNLPYLPKDVFRSYHNNSLLRTTIAIYKSDIIQIHIYFSSDIEDILLASFPSEIDIKSNIQGYANRLLHWFDIQLVKQDGRLKYNLGGIGNGVLDEKKSSIAKFKNEMSPMVIGYYQGVLPVSLKGKLYLSLKNKLIKIHDSVFNKDNK